MNFRLVFAVFFFVVLVIVGYAFFVPHTTKDEVPPPVESEPQPAPLVTLSSSFRRGVHTFEGTVEAPTPCTTVGVETTVASSTPSRITLSLTLAPDEGVCIQVVRALPFEATAEAPEDAFVELTVNGVAVEPEKES
jgi:hypothetical protein